MADPWSQFRVSSGAPDAPADPWAAFKVVPPEHTEIVPANSFAGLSKDEARAKLAGLPAGQRKAALRQWADSYVADERKGGGPLQYAGDVVRNVARGVPVLGAFADEANAGTAAALHAVTGGNLGSSYEEAKAYQDATDRAVDRDTTKLGSVKVPGVSQPVDITGAGLSKLAGGLMAAPAMPIVQAVRGTSILPSVANLGVTGAVYGGAHGAGEGNEADERARNAGWGAAFGAPLAAGLGLVGRGLGNAAGYVANRVRPVPPALQGYDRAAVDRVAREVADDNLGVTWRQQAAQLGPEGMLGDMGRNTQAATAGLARSPGGPRSIILGALDARKAGAPGRITQDVDAALGPAPNLPETIEATARQYKAAAKPFRDQFQQSPVPYTQQLEGIFTGLGDDLGPVLTTARRYANIDPASGQKQFFARQNPQSGQWQIERVPNASEWDYIKRALDNMARGQDKNDQRIFGHWARQVREGVDEALSPGAPQQSPWAQARALEADNFQIAEGVDAGRSAFSKGISPDQMRAEMFGVGQPARGGMSAAARAGYGLGARDEVRQIMGNSATAWGPNADNAARRALGADNAREKLEIIAGQPAAQTLTRRLDAETAFERTRDMADRNSITSTMQAVQKRLPLPVDSTDGSLATSSLSGMVMEGMRRAVNALTGGAYNERRTQIAADMARMLIAQGSQRDQIIGAIVQRALQANNPQVAGLILQRYLATAAIPAAGRAGASTTP